MDNSTPSKNQNQVYFKIVKIRLTDGTKPCKAYVDIRIGPLIVHGFSIVENPKQKGYFVSEPARYDKIRERNYRHVTLDEDYKEEVYKAAIAAFKVEFEEAIKKP